MRINVRGGTVDHGRRSLCESCRWSTVIRGPKLGDEIVECTQLSFISRRIPFPVMSCSDYIHRNQADLEEMQETALFIKAEPRRTQTGFGPGSKPSDGGNGPADE